MGLSKRQYETLKRNNVESNYLTREAVKDALFILMREKSFQMIKITEIIHKSGISRSAFYRNYKTKEEILYDYVNEITQIINQNATTSLRKNWEFTFHELLRNKDKINLILEAHLEYLILNQMNESLNTSSGNDFRIAMNNGLIFNVLMYWAKLSNEMNEKEATEHIIQSYREVIQEIQMYSLE